MRVSPPAPGSTMVSESAPSSGRKCRVYLEEHIHRDERWGAFTRGVSLHGKRRVFRWAAAPEHDDGRRCHAVQHPEEAVFVEGFHRPQNDRTHRTRADLFEGRKEVLDLFDPVSA